MNFKRSHERQSERFEFARDQRRQVNEFAQDVWQLFRAGRMLGEKRGEGSQNDFANRGLGKRSFAVQ
jgi:hypothetical protein